MGLLVLGAVLGIVAALAARPAPPSSEAADRTTAHRDRSDGAGGRPAAEDAWADGVVDEEDGVVPDGVTVLDDEHPGITRLDPDLLRALRSAAADADDDGITFVVHSGWRSPEYQEQLLRDAIAEHGSAEEAARWVAPPDRSLHVSGDAVDIDGSDARAWLAEHGATHGLCRTYGNEPWHFELHPSAVDDGCPPMYPDPTHDPRLQP